MRNKIGVIFITDVNFNINHIYTEMCAIYTEMCAMYTEMCAMYTEMCAMYTLHHVS